MAAHLSAAGRGAEDWAALAGSPPAQGASPGAAGGPGRGPAGPASHANGRPAPLLDGAAGGRAEGGEAAEGHMSDEAGWTSEDEDDADEEEADGAEAGDIGDDLEDEVEADELDEELVPEAR